MLDVLIDLHYRDYLSEISGKNQDVFRIKEQVSPNQKPALTGTKPCPDLYAEQNL